MSLDFDVFVVDPKPIPSAGADPVRPCRRVRLAKSAAVCAAIRGGLVHGLVTHTSLARALLSLADQRDGKR